MRPLPCDVIPNPRQARVRNLLLIAFLLGLATSLFAQAKHPFTFEDMMKLKRVGDPQVSPGGKWVIFSVVDIDLEANTKTPHVWIVPLGGDQEKSGVPHVSPGLRDVGKAGSSSASGALGMTSEREVIADQDADRPRWAPDGKRFAFLSTKEGGSQVWIADFDGTAGTVTGVNKLTSIATEAGGELWSPDGKNILFTSDVYPECDGAPEAETACNAKKVEEHEKSKVKALIFDRLFYRHWNAYKEGKRSHILVVSVPTSPKTGETWGTPASGGAGTLARDLTPGDYDAPEFSLGGQDDYAFSPDGQEICYTSNHDKVEATSTNNDLWTVQVNVGADAFVRPAASGASGVKGVVRASEGGQDPVELRSTGRTNASAPTQNEYVAEVLAHTKNITADNPASDSTPLYSPDGRYIAYRAQQRPGYESDRFRLMLYDRKTGKEKDLIGNALDLWVGTFMWMPNSQEIHFSAQEEEWSHIYKLRLNPTNEEMGLAPYSSGDDLVPTPDGNSLVITRMSVQAPPEIYQVGNPPDNAFSKQLTHLNDAVLSQIDMSPLEQFWFPGASPEGAVGNGVQGFLVKPPNFDPAKKYPVKFLVHGGPQGAWGDDWSYRWNPELFAANGYVVIMINFHGSTGYGQKFVDSINGDWGGGPFEDLMKGLDYAEEHYSFIDKTRECALGASFGGYMVNWIVGHTDRFKCAVSHDGDFNNEASWGTTEELWFPGWEFHGTPWENRELYRKWSPHLFVQNFKTPTLVIHGQLDYRVDVSEGFQMFTTLQMLGVPSKMLYFPDEGHWVLKPQNARLWYKTVNDWVDRWIGDQGTK